MDLLAALQAADYAKAQPLIEKVLRYEPSNELMLEYRVVVQRALSARTTTPRTTPTTTASWRPRLIASSASSSASIGVVERPDAEEKRADDDHPEELREDLAAVGLRGTADELRANVATSGARGEEATTVQVAHARLLS